MVSQIRHRLALPAPRRPPQGYLHPLCQRHPSSSVPLHKTSKAAHKAATLAHLGSPETGVAMHATQTMVQRFAAAKNALAMRIVLTASTPSALCTMDRVRLRSQVRCCCLQTSCSWSVRYALMHISEQALLSCMCH